MKQLILEVSSSVIHYEVQKSLKQLVCAKGWYKVEGVLVYDLVTLSTIKDKLCTILYKEHSSRYNLLSAREGKLVMFRNSS